MELFGTNLYTDQRTFFNSLNSKKVVITLSRNPLPRDAIGSEIWVSIEVAPTRDSGIFLSKGALLSENVALIGPFFKSSSRHCPF